MGDRSDIIIIGGGPGGYVAALRAAQLGLSVALAERERIGGVCLNRGCIPTKTLLSDVEGYHWVRRSFELGIVPEVPRLDFNRLIERKNGVVDELVTGLEKLLSAKGVRIVTGTARLLQPGVVSVDSGEILEANAVILATGSRPWIPPIDGAGLPGVVGTREILDVQRLPESLVIIGGGIIGQEFATIFSALGCKVTVLEALDRILYEVDRELARKYSSLLLASRVKTDAGVKVQRIEKSGDRLRVIYEKRSKEKTTEGDLVLMATGRRPFIEGSGAEELGLEIRGGAVRVDQFLRTSVQGIYAIGDVVGRKMLAHVASYHAERAVEHIAGHPRSVEDELVPCCVYTLPQIAWVGPNEQEALDAGKSFRTSTFSLSASGKALAMGESRGWIKFLEDSETGRLMAAHMMGPGVSELVGELTLAIRKGMSASDIADTIHPHPTISEALREAALGLLDGPIHAAARVKTFEGRD
jgi:dihydrolipoamide dehydrogenase